MTKWFELASTTYNPIDPAANGSQYKTERAGEEDAQQRSLIRIWRENYRASSSTRMNRMRLSVTSKGVFSPKLSAFSCARAMVSSSRSQNPSSIAVGVEKSHALRGIRALSSRIAASNWTYSHVVSFLLGSVHFLDRCHSMLASHSIWAEANRQQVQY